MLWHILTTAPQREFRAQEALESIGVEVMLPVQYKWHDVRKGVAKGRKLTERVVRAHPMFPRYIFAGFEGFVPWTKIRDLNHAGRPLFTGRLDINGMPYNLTPPERLMLRNLSDVEAPVVPPIRSCNIAAGDMVRIADGPFAGQLVKVTKVDKNQNTIRAVHDLLGALVVNSAIVEVVKARAA